MKYVALTLLLLFALLAATLAVLHRATSNRSLAKRDPRRSRGDDADEMVGRFAARRPERAIAMGLLDRESARVSTAGTDPSGRALDGGTVFEVGSVTKAFTGALLADMVVRGEVELDGRLGDVLRGATLSSTAANMTLRQLATHTSGLPRLPKDLSSGEDRKDPYAHYTRDRLLASLEGIVVAQTPTSHYSNYGVGLLGEALAIHRGTTYPELLAERVLRPLGLNSGSFGEPGVAPTAPLIQGYMGKKSTLPWTLPSLAGAGGLRVSTDDLLRFLAALVSPDDHWREVRDLMWQVHHDDGRSKVGLCWQIEGEGDERIIWHNGSTYGASSFVGIRPSTGIGVTGLQNQSELLGMMVGNTSAAEAIGRALMD